MSTYSLMAEAERLVAAGNVPQAASLLDAAAAQGDANAMMRLAMWRLAGTPLDRDLPAARALLRRAADAGHVEAARMEVAFSANGTGADPDWALALGRLTNLAASDETAARQRAIVAAMDLDGGGHPSRLPAGSQIGAEPTVFRYERFLSPAECAHIAHAARDLLQPAMIRDPRTGRNMVHPIRTSHEAVIGPIDEDLVIAAIERRIAAITDTDFRQGEPLSVLHYAPGQQYRPHYDALPGTVNQRTKTVLLYLNQGFGGGETLFLNSGLKVIPRAGDAIVFDNVDAAGRPDKATQHASLPVTQGAKWLATRWIREKPYNPWTDYGK